MTFRSPFQLKRLYDSVSVWFHEGFCIPNLGLGCLWHQLSPSQDMGAAVTPTSSLLYAAIQVQTRGQHAGSLTPPITLGISLPGTLLAPEPCWCSAGTAVQMELAACSEGAWSPPQGCTCPWWVHRAGRTGKSLCSADRGPLAVPFLTLPHAAWHGSAQDSLEACNLFNSACQLEANLHWIIIFN